MKLYEQHLLEKYLKNDSGSVQVSQRGRNAVSRIGGIKTLKENVLADASKWFVCSITRSTPVMREVFVRVEYYRDVKYFSFRIIKEDANGNPNGKTGHWGINPFSFRYNVKGVRVNAEA